MRKSAASVERDFKTGLITEATGLNYPENACIETYNCEFNILGTVTRRAGFDLENEYTTQTIDKTLSAISTYVWKNVTGDGLISFLVVQIGSKLYFYNTSNPASISAGYNSSTVDLTTFSPSGAPTPRINKCQFSDGFGKLFVVHPNLEAFYVTYNSSGDNFTATQINLQTRDFEGQNDTLAVDNRPTSTLTGLSKEHAYNLRNQGWNTTVLTAWDTAFTTMPSNSDVWWSYKNSSDVFDTTTVANSAAGNTKAPKGHFILNPYSQDRSTASGVADITTVTTETQRANTTAFHAGRVWYTGINYVKFNTKIYFSQIIESPTQFGLCYQQNDPTAEDLFAILPSDGGVIDIPEAGQVYKLFPIQSSLLVFAARGVWSINGSTGVGFTANDYVVSKLSSFRSLSASSFVEVNGAPIYWTTDGIFTVKSGQNQAGQTVLEVLPLSFKTIQTFYDEIPNTSKQYVQGYFNPLTQKAIWLYKSAASSTIEDNFEFDKAHVYNALTGAFYPWTISEGDVKVHAIFVADASGSQTIEYEVVDVATETVIDASGDTVVAFLQSTNTVAPTFKYVVSYADSGDKFTMADNIDSTYVDWNSYSDSVDYESYFITGYKIRGEGQRKFQSNVVTFFNNGNGKYEIQGIWDYALNSNTGRYTSKQRLTYQDSSYANLHKRVKLRGNGKTLQYRIGSVSGQPFSVIGWSTVESINTTP